MAKKQSGSENLEKTTASYSRPGRKDLPASENNPSKYAPTEMAEMDMQQLGTEDGLMKLFTDGIKDLYWAENALVKALPKMAKSAGSPDLSAAITNHLQETINQVARLEQVFEILGKSPQAKKCDAMEGLTKEGEGVIEDTDPGTAARDLGIIMASQKVEHYEMAAYTGLIKLAGKLSLDDAASILSQTLAEEQQSDDKLSAIAETISIDSTEEM